MARKKHLKGIDEADMDFIDSKFKADELSEGFEYVNGYKNQLKTLNYKIELKCKNERQKEFLNTLKDKKKIICFGMGSAGTGKSYLSLAFGLKMLKEQEFSKIIMVIPTSQSIGKDMSFGFLKGELEDKTKPFKDVDRYTIEKILKNSGNLEAKTISSALIGSGYIQYEFVNFMLGKTFDDSLILINEAEQYTVDEMRLILTRLGENSKMVITGDESQITRASLMKNKTSCGLSHTVEKLKDMDETSVVEFHKEDIVRNPLITKILEHLD